MSNRSFLIWRAGGALAGAATWPFLMPLGSASIPLSRWLVYGCWSSLLGWLSWSIIGGAVEACLARGRASADRVAAFAAALCLTVLGLLFTLFLAIPVGDEPWHLLDPAIPCSILALGVVVIRLHAVSLLEDLQRWRATGAANQRPGLFLSVPLMVLACGLLIWLVKVIYWDLLVCQPYRPGA